MSFAALQRLNYVPWMMVHPMLITPLAFSATLADNEAIYFDHAMRQTDKHLFIKSMLKEIDDLTSDGVRK
jgi:hypothetical protein